MDLDWCSQKLGSKSAGEDRWGMCWDPPSFQLCWCHFSCLTVGLYFSSVSSYCFNTWLTFSCSFLASSARLSWDLSFSNCCSAHPGIALRVLYCHMFTNIFICILMLEQRTLLSHYTLWNLMIDFCITTALITISNRKLNQTVACLKLVYLANCLTGQY